MSVLRNEWERGGDLPREEGPEFPGRICDVLVICPHHLGSILDLEKQYSSDDVLNLLQTILEASHNAEIASAPSQSLEEVRIMLLASGNE